MCVCVCVCVCVCCICAHIHKYRHHLPLLTQIYFCGGIYIYVHDNSQTYLMVKAIDCRIVVIEFELRSRYHVHFRTNTIGKGMNPLILTAMG